MAELETLSGRKRSRTTRDLHLIVERFVSWGGETPAERLAARELTSRDVRAIRHLKTAKVLPSRVQGLAATPGEGLHAWARQRAVANRVCLSPIECHRGCSSSEGRGTAAGATPRGQHHDTPARRRSKGTAPLCHHRRSGSRDRGAATALKGPGKGRREQSFSSLSEPKAKRQRLAALLDRAMGGHRLNAR
jgi:hypothetical protein